MLPSRFAPAQSSAMRKSRLEGKPSLLPKPRQHGSTDRLSADTRRPSTTTHRSSSAEPSRATYAGGRLSREASSTNLPNARSRSQQSEKFGQSSMMTPLRSSHFSRPTTTPVRTPSEDQASRCWQSSLEKALAFVTIKDQRPISSVAWQRAELARVTAALSARDAGAAPAPLVRPLTIARFVAITGELLNAIIKDAKLNNDNYVTKLPHLSKRLLYPGTVSKSWLKTVNTLHAFPHALALIAYLLDLANYIDTPVLDEMLYIGKDQLSCLRRDYTLQCWIRFQEPGHKLDDLEEEYLRNLKIILGNDEEKIMELEQDIQRLRACLEDSAEAAARAEEARLLERRTALEAALRAERAARRQLRAQLDATRAATRDKHLDIRQLEADIERATAESNQLSVELKSQPLSVDERTKLLDEVDYARRVLDSKRALAEQITKMVLSKETELGLWQKKTLDSCVEYKQGLIHLSAEFPHLAALAVDEKELMAESCGAQVCGAVEALRGVAAGLAGRRNDLARQRGAAARRRALLLEEARARVVQVRTSISEAQQELEQALRAEAAESAAWQSAAARLRTDIALLQDKQAEYAQADTDLEYWEEHDKNWRTNLTKLNEYIESQRAEKELLLQHACDKRAALVRQHITKWNQIID